jgi:hypothetical protein
MLIISGNPEMRTTSCTTNELYIYLQRAADIGMKFAKRRIAFPLLHLPQPARNRMFVLAATGRRQIKVPA